MSHNRTHHTTLARRLSRAVNTSYQQALQQVRAAAAAGALPDVLDDTGMNSALSILIAATGDSPDVGTPASEADVADSTLAADPMAEHVASHMGNLLHDAPDGHPRHATPGPHEQLNAALRRAGIALPMTVDYRPDGYYRVWREGHVVMTAIEVPHGSSRWTIEIVHEVEGPVAGASGATVDEVATALIAAAEGRATPRMLATMGIAVQHQCTDSCHRYRYFARAWCLTHARELIEADPTAAIFIKDLIITSLDEHIGLASLPRNMGRIQLIPIDTDRAATADLSAPLLAIRLLGEGEDEGRHVSDFIIDSWEQVYRARTEGRTSLPAYRLSDSAERAVRRSPDR